MRNIHLHGALAKEFGDNFRLNADTPGAIIRLLAANFPDFLTRLREGYYKIIRGRRHGGAHLTIDDVELNLGKADFHVVPVIAGAKSGGVMKAVLGVALVGAAIFFSGGTLAAPLSGLGSAIPGLGGITFGNVAALGLVAAVSGISQMIAPPTKDIKAGTDQSYAFNGPMNVDAQGYPVPVAFGELIVGGIAVSSGFDVATIPVGATYSELLAIGQ